MLVVDEDPVRSDFDRLVESVNKEDAELKECELNKRK